MREYGPGILPVYKEAAIVGVRAEEIADLLVNLEPALRAELLQIISDTSTRPTGAPLTAERSDAAPLLVGTSDDLARKWATVRSHLATKGVKS